MANSLGVELAIVWNKSQREHGIVGTSPADVRHEADEAIRAATGNIEYHVDADHIKVAAELGEAYLGALKSHRELVGKQIRDNLFVQHIKPLFL
jgi:hypothetical protein